jgi:hypothetical protein
MFWLSLWIEGRLEIGLSPGVVLFFKFEWNSIFLKLFFFLSLSSFSLHFYFAGFV